jgi:ubiquinone/menaquinone biosynthesis C-methylase UbiE
MGNKQYNEIASEYLKGEREVIGELKEEDELLRSRVKDIKGKRLLDLGCGAGNELNYYKSLGTEVKGIDISEKMLGEARGRYPLLRDSLILADFNEIPFLDESFDVVTSRLALHYSMDLEKVFREIFRVLAKGGVAHIFVANPLMSLVYKNNKDYSKQEVVNLPILRKRCVVRQPSHTFSEYLSEFVLKNFSIEEFYEGKETFVEECLGEGAVKVPTFLYLRFRKK